MTGGNANSLGDLSDLNLRLLRILLALIRNGSVTRTAEELDVTQSSVSQSLGRLRSHFNDPLFIRTHSGVAPTQVALSLAEPAARILDIAQEAFVGAKTFDPLTAKRQITLCLGHAGELSVVPELLFRLSREAPGCSLRTIGIAEADIGLALERGEVDLTIAGPIRNCDALCQQKLFTHRFAVIVSRFSTIPDVLTLEQFRRLGHIIHRPINKQEPIINIALDTLGARPNVLYTACTNAMFPLIVAQNPQAASIVPAVLAAPFIKLGVIREVGVTFDLPVIDVHQYWHRGTDRSSFDKWLRDLVWRALYRNRDLHIPKRTAPSPGAVETRPRQHA